MFQFCFESTMEISCLDRIRGVKQKKEPILKESCCLCTEGRGGVQIKKKNEKGFINGGKRTQTKNKNSKIHPDPNKKIKIN